MRWDAGFYATISQKPMEAFKADVVAALETYAVASRQARTEFAASLEEKRVQDVADVALGTLNDLFEKHEGMLAQHAQRGADIGNANSEAADSQEETKSEPKPENDRTEQTIVDDLSRYSAALFQKLWPHTFSNAVSLCVDVCMPSVLVSKPCGTGRR